MLVNKTKTMLILIGFSNIFFSPNLRAASSSEVIYAASTLCFLRKSAVLGPSCLISDRQQERNVNDQLRDFFGVDTGIRRDNKKVFSCLLCCYVGRSDLFAIHLKKFH